uniref:Lysosome-associated membrane glycoprotein 1 n=1 Tax=Aceria tosichella TaxID=561515 RepID=A0A6G1SN49_9ACAR
MYCPRTYQIAIVTVAFMALLVAGQGPQPSAVVTPTKLVENTTVCNLTSTKPSVQQQSYVFNTCIVAKFAAYFSVGTNAYVELKDGVVSANKSTCESAPNATTPLNPKLVINFGNCAELEFEFGKNQTEIFVKSVNGYYKNGTQEKPFANATQLFKTNGANHYYKCNAEQSVASDKDGAQLVLSNFAYEAFRNTTGTDFYKMPEECALDSSGVSDLVRIGVGICLVALVALVLVAFFIGRRRWAERSSYESV